MAQFLAGRGLGDKFTCPALPHRPEEAIAVVEAVLGMQDKRQVTFIGSSLGGFYATWLAERHDCRAILIQPAVSPHVGLEQYLGMQKNLYTGAEYELTRAPRPGTTCCANIAKNRPRLLVASLCCPGLGLGSGMDCGGGGGMPMPCAMTTAQAGEPWLQPGACAYAAGDTAPRAASASETARAPERRRESR